MSPICDPERSEAGHLLGVDQFTGKKVLEIGCGNANLTWQYAGMVREVFEVDPSFTDLQKARSSQAATLPNLGFTGARGEALPLPAGFFDVAVLSSFP